MHRNRFRSVGVAVGSAAMVLAGSLVAATPASAAIDCTGESAHQTMTSQANSIRANQPVRSGLYEECSVRFNGSTSATLECFQVNARGNVWWFVRTPKGQGWVYESNLGFPPSRFGRCAGAVQPAP
ncbi:hypothetical protein [Actinoplanes sp. NPDC051859]|uniref:hypothetical protein n=1 Tax=Actinoplanes sp. NPDC051859 TaxID=3363909 RepID=UPI0037A41B02